MLRLRSYPAFFLAFVLTSCVFAGPAGAIGVSQRVALTAAKKDRRARVTTRKVVDTKPSRNTSSDPAGVASPAPASPPVKGELFRDEFSYPDGLITNEYATWNPASSSARVSPAWEMTSGSFFAQGGTGWTGPPDGCSSSSPASSPCTASDVFRLNTVRHDFGNVTVSLDLRSNSLTSSSRTPAVSWDGVHVWLHYQTEYSLYYASFNRRDGRVVIKKKCPGGSENGGTYYELGPGEVGGYPIPFGIWQHLAASIQDNSDGSVTITMSRNGTKLLSATDTGVGCAPITGAGAVGVRGDNDDFNIDNFIVAAN